MDDLYNFNAKGRIPVVPLSYEHKELAVPREFILDYTTGDAYVCTESGEIINICLSDTVMEAFSEYLIQNPGIIANLTVVDENNNSCTVEESFFNIYQKLDELFIEINEFSYAEGTTDGGSATSAEKVNHQLTIKEAEWEKIFDGSEEVEVHLEKYLEKAGGTVEGDLTLEKKLILEEGVTFGDTLPATGVEGELFFLLAD